jgi:AcrR family transcriptional regulator
MTTPDPVPLTSTEASYVNPRVGRTRAAALAAARDVLVTEGWDAVTHVRVSERSGLSRPTLYRHWPDRSALLAAAVLHEAAATPHTRSTGHLRADLLTELRGLRSRFLEQSSFRVLAALVDRAEWDEEMLAVKVGVTNEHNSAPLQVLHDAVQRGELRADLDLRVALSQLIGPLVFRRFLSNEDLTDGFLESIVDSFIAEYGTRRRPPKARRGGDQ